jgi:hypothetical protein
VRRAAAEPAPCKGEACVTLDALSSIGRYAPFHDKMQEWLGWDESNARIQGAATNGVMTDGMMTELLTFVAELKQTTGPDDVPPAGSGGEQGSAGIERVASAKKEVEEQMMVKWMESLRDRPELASALRAVLQDVPSSRERGYSRIDRMRGRHSARCARQHPAPTFTPPTHRPDLTFVSPPPPAPPPCRSPHVPAGSRGAAPRLPASPAAPCLAQGALAPTRPPTRSTKRITRSALRGRHPPGLSHQPSRMSWAMPSGRRTR